MIYTMDDCDLVVCDDHRCGAVNELAYAEEDGWAISRLAGPHYCPYGVTWRFRALIDQAFGAPPA